MKNHIAWVALLGILFIVTSIHASVPPLMNYQGRLTDENGVPVPDGDYTIQFRIYSAPIGGDALWREEQTVPVAGGQFSVVLGDSMSIPDTVFSGAVRWLGLQVIPDPEMTPRKPIVSVGYALRALDADTAEYALSAPGFPDNDWVITGNVLSPAADYGLSMRQSNVMHGHHDSTHVNFGIACTTGTSGLDRKYCTAAGGRGNAASGYGATVSGGDGNTASGYGATVGGGDGHISSGRYATVAGGLDNRSYGDYSFTAGLHTFVNPGDDHSAAFNAQRTTASGQTRVGIISKASGTFTIDHPTEPMNKILNHYFVESPEMVLVYRGEAIVGSDGRVDVHLPDYFDALNRNPMVQLTGVGTSDVYVSEKVIGNRFVIGGKPGTEVYWTVTGDRKDPSAEITRILMPAEQLKEGDLTGHSLDDDFLVATKSQLERTGQAGEFRFRTAAGQEKYEKSLRPLEERE